MRGGRLFWAGKGGIPRTAASLPYAAHPHGRFRTAASLACAAHPWCRARWRCWYGRPRARARCANPRRANPASRRTSSHPCEVQKCAYAYRAILLTLLHSRGCMGFATPNASEPGGIATCVAGWLPPGPGQGKTLTKMRLVVSNVPNMIHGVARQCQNGPNGTH